MRIPCRLVLLPTLPALLLLSGLPGPAAAQSDAQSGAQGDDPGVEAALDAYWGDVSRTVAEGDFEGYAALYHPDAVLVSAGGTGPGTSVPITDALAGWRQGFTDTREGRAEAGVDFRLTRRLHSATTAHETGIFRYTMTPAGPAGGEETVARVHFEALLVKKEGRWLMLMEYQKEPATEAEWRAAAG